MAKELEDKRKRLAEQKRQEEVRRAKGEGKKRETMNNGEILLAVEPLPLRHRRLRSTSQTSRKIVESPRDWTNRVGRMRGGVTEMGCWTKECGKRLEAQTGSGLAKGTISGALSTGPLRSLLEGGGGVMPIAVAAAERRPKPSYCQRGPRQEVPR